MPKRPRGKNPEGGPGPAETVRVPAAGGSTAGSRLGPLSAGARGLPDPETMASKLINEPVPGPVRIIFLDADGTLTDGLIGCPADFRHFWVRDGLALQWARDLGVLPVVISGRESRALVARMEDLGIECYQGIQDKVTVAEGVLKREGVGWEECVMVGDDLPDVALIKRVGWPIAVANAQPEVKLLAKTVLGTHGGHGAVREAVEMVLRHNGTWEDVLRRYEAL